MKSPSPKCYMTFWDMTIYNDTLNRSDITPICELITELDFITDLLGTFILPFKGKVVLYRSRNYMTDARQICTTKKR